MTDNGSCYRSRMFRAACRRLGLSPNLHQAIYPEDQRQGRALHPVGPARVGLRLDLPELQSANSRPGQLAASLQLAPPTCRHRWCLPNVQTPIVKKQPLDGSQLARTHPAQRGHPMRMECWQFPPCYDNACRPDAGSRYWFPVRETMPACDRDRAILARLQEVCRSRKAGSRSTSRTSPTRRHCASRAEKSRSSA